MTRFLLPFSLVVLAGAIAASPQKPPTPDELSASFLKGAEKILQEDPTDGRFGINRLPTLHDRQYFDGRKPNEKAVSDAWDALGQDNYMALVSFGRFDKDGAPGRRGVMSGHYQLNWAPLVKSNAFFDAENQFNQHVAPEGAKRLWNSRAMQSRTEMRYVDRTAIVQFRKVMPSSPKCFSCHTDGSMDKPLGVLALIRVPKTPGS